MTDSDVIDSSVWIDYFFFNKFTDIIDYPKIHLISSLALFEIERKMRKEKVGENIIKKSLEYVHLKSLVIVPHGKIAQKAVEVSFAYNLGAMDAFMYATALLSQAQLITCDNDFRGLPGVTVVS